MTPTASKSIPATMWGKALPSASQVRQWATAVLANGPAIQRTQYMPGVGHHVWNGLDDNNDRAVAVITAFLHDEPAPLPNSPTRDEIPTFLRDRK
ncbi:hypothetical protein [Streptomyces goshikiensis]|uniref:hypothetical protein n=1 Tax=Streptomyces goshikiensis TaxID=1942 RepID=UPI0036826F13